MIPTYKKAVLYRRWIIDVPETNFLSEQYSQYASFEIAACGRSSICKVDIARY